MSIVPVSDSGGNSQRIPSAVVDIVFFLAIAFLGVKKILGEPVIATLFSAYAASRFGVAMNKRNLPSDTGSSGTSGSMPKVSVPKSEPRRPDPRTFGEHKDNLNGEMSDS